RMPLDADIDRALLRVLPGHPVQRDRDLSRAAPAQPLVMLAVRDPARGLAAHALVLHDTEVSRLARRQPLQPHIQMAPPLSLLTVQARSEARVALVRQV